MTAKKLLGIDIGGTKLAVCLGDDEGNIVGSRRIPQDRDYPKCMQQLIEAAKGLIADAGLQLDDISAVGISAPGPLDLEKGLILESPNLGWNVVPIRADIANALQRPVRMDNDANAGVLAEWFFGSGKGKTDIVYLTMSTGVGGGVITGGKLLSGKTGNAAEVGHMVLDINGPACNCGLSGCLEAYTGGRAIAQRLQETLRNNPDHAMYRLPCVDGKLENLNFQAIREGSKVGIPLAMAWWDEICLRLAQGIAICVTVYNPELVVLGTAAYYAGDYLMEPVRRLVPRFCWPDFWKPCEIRTSALGLKIGELAGISIAMYGLKEGFDN